METAQLFSIGTSMVSLAWCYSEYHSVRQGEEKNYPPQKKKIIEGATYPWGTKKDFFYNLGIEIGQIGPALQLCAGTRMFFVLFFVVKTNSATNKTLKVRSIRYSS